MCDNPEKVKINAFSGVIFAAKSIRQSFVFCMLLAILLELFGYTEDEVIGRNVLGTIVPETESGSSRDLASLIREIETDPDRFKNNENENMKKNGDRLWVSWTNTAILNEAGQLEILSIGNDLTERKIDELSARIRDVLKGD